MTNPTDAVSPTWSLSQVAQAESLRARLSLSDEAVARSNGAAQKYAEDAMAERLTEMAHPFAIELHRDDFEVRWTRNDSTPWEIMGEMRWRPTTNEVELVGGHLDGQRYAVKSVGEALRVSRPASTPWFDEDLDRSSAALVEMADTYEMAGWRETDRVWVYAIR